MCDEGKLSLRYFSLIIFYVVDSRLLPDGAICCWVISIAVPFLIGSGGFFGLSCRRVPSTLPLQTLLKMGLTF
jgi:hypothetical protein